MDQALDGKLKAGEVPDDIAEAIRFRNWVTVTHCGDWWVYVAQPHQVVDRLFAVEAIVASKRPGPSGGAGGPE